MFRNFFQYIIQNMNQKAVERNPLMLERDSDEYNTQEMCKKAAEGKP